MAAARLRPGMNDVRPTFPVIVNGRSLNYATPIEARHQFDRWVAEAIRFATGTHCYTITYRGSRIDVLGHDDRSIIVVETRRGVRRTWTTQEMRDALAAPAEAVRREAAMLARDSEERRNAAAARQRVAEKSTRLAAAGVRRR